MTPYKALNQGVAPVTYGEGSRPPRGDYARARADYTCEQAWSLYSRPCKTLQTRMNTGFAGHAPMVVSPEFNSNGV